MLIRIPLLPLQIDVQWRLLGKFQLSIGSIMLMVGSWFALAINQERLDCVHRHHIVQAYNNAADSSQQYDIVFQYQLRRERNEALLALVTFSALAFVFVLAIGRMMNWYYERCRM